MRSNPTTGDPNPEFQVTTGREDEGWSPLKFIGFLDGIPCFSTIKTSGTLDVEIYSVEEEENE